MAITSTFRQQTGTPVVFAASGGDAAITLTSVAHQAARQGVKVNLGDTFGQEYSAEAHIEFAATPTAGESVDLYWAPSGSATAGTDNPGGVSGTDAAYTGYSSNLAASLRQLQFIGRMTVTTQTTATVQKAHAGFFRPANQYGSLVVVNNSGASIHSSATNCKIILTPLEAVGEA